MKKLLYMLAVLTGLTSCADSYNIQGTSSVSSLDGSKLYLKAVKDKKLESIDSCEVVHGTFKFAGLLDTVMMVNLFMDDRSLMMPIVLETGNIIIRIDDSSRKVSGTPLNELLYAFIDQHNQLSNRMIELGHRESQMLLDGIDEREIVAQLSAEAEQISMEEDTLVTNFIVKNSDNVLGPGVFMMMTAGMEYPMLTPQIEHIMTLATEAFKNDPYVSEYYKTASEIQAKMQGLDSSAPAAEQGEPSDSVIQNILNGKE
ncbi:MAG: DUF4369 domain-containing protein [Prevotella sp.]|nr:DUF4369 domain-containing protein [Prevotella sp.]